MVVKLTFEVDRTKYFIERSGYTILDLLSDIGGIHSILLSFFAVIISVFNYKNFANTLTSKFYRLKSAKKATAKEEKLFVPSKL